MNIYAKIALIALLIGQTLSVWAQNPGQLLPWAETPQTGDRFGPSTGGYGYLARSEAAAHQILDFGCSEEDLQTYQACFEDQIPHEYSSIENLTQSYSQSMIHDKLRHQYFEYLALQLAALNTTAHAPIIPMPSCLRDSQKAKYIQQHIQGLQRHRPYDNSIQWAAPSYLPLLLKYRAIYDHFNAGNLVRALYLNDQIASVREDVCANNLNSNRCISAKNRQFRLRAAYPLLFSMPRPAREHGQFFQNVEDQNLSRFKQKVYALIGGQTIYDDLINQRSHHSLSQLENTIRDLNYIPEKKQAKDDLFNEIKRLQTAYKGTLKLKLEGLCDASTYALLQTEPTVTRQMLNDMSEDERSLSKSIICQSPARHYLRHQRPCEGVSGGPLDKGNPVIVDRQNHLYSPHYKTDQNLTITRPKHPTDAPYEINLTIHFQRDLDVSEDKFQSTVKQWQKEIQNWYNCQVGQIARYTDAAGQTHTCPIHEDMKKVLPIKFNISTETSAQGNLWSKVFGNKRPTLQVHRCYHTELKLSDCQKIREKLVQQCVDKGFDLSFCEKNTETAGHAKNNEEDSSNLSINSSNRTVIHESGHFLGLPDEYLREGLPFNVRGEKDSIMNDTESHVIPRLYPRHLELILAPIRCLNPDGSL